MDWKMFGTVRGSGAEAPVAIGNFGDVGVSQFLPPKALLAAANAAYVIEDGTARAAVTAVPASTTSLFGLWNGEEDGGKVYVIDRIGLTIAAQAATTTFAARLYFNMTRLRQSAPTASGTIAPLGGGGVGSKARGVATPTVVAADGHYGLGFSANGLNDVETTAPAFGVDIPVEGGILLRPGRTLAFNIFATSTSVTGHISVFWHEVQLPLSG